MPSLKRKKLKMMKKSKKDASKGLANLERKLDKEIWHSRSFKGKSAKKKKKRKSIRAFVLRTTEEI